MSKKTKIICFCGSIRIAMEAFKKAEYESVLNGNIALLPCCMFVDIERVYGAESDYKSKADAIHQRKIDICDEVFILNVNGYIGESTRNEILYAQSIGKPIYYLESDILSQSFKKYCIENKVRKANYGLYRIRGCYKSLKEIRQEFKLKNKNLNHMFL